MKQMNFMPWQLRSFILQFIVRTSDVENERVSPKIEDFEKLSDQDKNALTEDINRTINNLDIRETNLIFKENPKEKYEFLHKIMIALKKKNYLSGILAIFFGPVEIVDDMFYQNFSVKYEMSCIVGEGLKNKNLSTLLAKHLIISSKINSTRTIISEELKKIIRTEHDPEKLLNIFNTHSENHTSLFRAFMDQYHEVRYYDVASYEKTIKIFGEEILTKYVEQEKNQFSGAICKLIRIVSQELLLLSKKGEYGINQQLKSLSDELNKIITAPKSLPRHPLWQNPKHMTQIYRDEEKSPYAYDCPSLDSSL